MPKSATKIKNKKLTADVLRQKLKLKHLTVKEAFSTKHPQVEKYFRKRGIDPAKLREHSARIIGAGILTGALILKPVQAKPLPTPQDAVSETVAENGTDLKTGLSDTLKKVLPERTRPLTREEEKFLESVIQNFTGVDARATLEGEHLNTTYGRIGLEQHLRRYPGDTINEHGEGQVLKEGLAPGLGAWGYFASSRSELTPQLEENERWYAVVQTLYLSDWNTRQPYLKDWYKYRKVLIVNTVNGNAVVADVADSGPAAWTGKQYGGSPEVMNALGGPKYTKGAVIVFFVDDPENKVPLGPVDYTKLGGPGVILKQI